MYALPLLVSASLTTLVAAIDIRLYSNDPARTCTGTTTAICSNIPYEYCCARGSTPIYRSVLCSGLDTIVDTGTIPDYCIGYSVPPGRSYTPCACSCNAEAASEDNSGNVCLNCDAVSGLQLRSAAVFYPGSSAKRSATDLEEVGDKQCIGTVEPDVMEIDGQYFMISAKHNVPDEVTEHFWELFNSNPGIKFDDIPANLKAFHNESAVARLTAEELQKATARPLVIRGSDRSQELTKRQGLPAQCPAA